MKFDDFEIHANPYIINAYCKECRCDLIEISNGWFSRVMFCPKCENIYALKLIKIPKNKINGRFLEQARKEVNQKIQETEGCS